MSDLVKRWTMTDAEWVRFKIYKQLPTTLKQLKCDSCRREFCLYMYNKNGYCHVCIDWAVKFRTSFSIHDGGINEPINFSKRNFGTKKRPNRSVSSKADGAA